MSREISRDISYSINYNDIKLCILNYNINGTSLILLLFSKNFWCFYFLRSYFITEKTVFMSPYQLIIFKYDTLFLLLYILYFTFYVIFISKYNLFLYLLFKHVF